MVMTSQTYTDLAVEQTATGVSWGAVLAGAFAAAALSLILIVLGIGLGFSAVSPWPHRGIDAGTLGMSSIAWLVLTQIVASGVGGYLAGRLRIKWATVHTDEVYFRDTAHGFLAWAVAALVSAALIGGVLGNMMATGATAGAALTAGAVAAVPAMANDTSGHSGAGSGRETHQEAEKYLVDSLFRASPNATEGTAESDAAVRAEAGRIFANSIHAGALPAQDREYLAQLVAKRTGLSVADADKRVSDTFAIAHDALATAEQNARQAADKARKAATYAALWMFVSLLCGAFCASLFATLGGRQRDSVIHIPVV